LHQTDTRTNSCLIWHSEDQWVRSDLKTRSCSETCGLLARASQPPNIPHSDRTALSGFPELGFPASRQGRLDEIRRVLELVGILEYADTKIAKLSKGMVQRLSVAQAMMGTPEVLILDEPMIGLDPAGSAHFREVFREFASQRGGTVFMSSHIMSEVESLCTSVAIIHGGRILHQGQVADVIRKVFDYSIIYLEARGLTEQAISKIREIANVSKIVPNGDSLEIIVQAHADVRPDISDIVVKSGAKLYSIRQAGNMLERAYIEALSKSNPGVRPI
jgi:ABC-2 type transport system ATP-binding protein